METSGFFYAVLGRALSAGHPFGLASFFCLCEGTVHTSALCRWLLDSVKPVPNCKVMLLQRIALPVLKCCTPWLFWICFYGQRISLCWAGGSCRDALIRILITKLDWRQAQGGQSQTGMLHIKRAKPLWVSWSSESQDSASPGAWLDVPTLLCVASRGGKTCKKPLSFAVSSLPAFFFFFFPLGSSVEKL